MAQHVKILGVLHIVFGAIGVFAAIMVLMIFRGWNNIPIQLQLMLPPSF